ncbi:PREDICTED: uncharacterized protein LOC109340251 isoform X3 [Lupinus angustifolius]|uniref:uncharacterized protein LOC109340251 isoform X3 n=1 Tax=Lupinus angustifolius TaxID=3871 RepID=UPI00092F91C9|nr:PREDICTED: uncharacterized protein LOC109340251 isoform X3 [Lupinus angustifolius]
MIGKGVLRKNFQPRSCSEKKVLRTNQTNGKFKNVITIDIDNDDVDDVVILEFHDCRQRSFHGSSVPSKEGVCTPQSVISIDDDDDESDDADHTGNIADRFGESDSDASSSKRFSPSPSRMQIHIDVDDSHVNEKKSNKHKIRQTCSAKTAARNRYGLDSSESESSKSDCSDCEVIEVCDLWEKASVKRKRRWFNDQFCPDQHASSSGIPCNTDTEVGREAKQHPGSPVYSGPSNGKYVKRSQSSFSTEDDSQVNEIYSNLGAEKPFKDSGKKVDEESSKSVRPEFMEERQVENNGSALRSKDGILSEVNTVDSNCPAFDERNVNCDGLVLNAQNVGFNASNQIDIINEREKLKETDEYKRVIEEEWASRQRQLQIQAEEAQRLRKRKKAEAQRLLDMQRRQKERIAEVRESQKKDEEFMNMKEQLRAEIQRGLNKLETQCRDMASLLRGLGIHVGGDVPLANEVRTAYKKALLKFHPDRASRDGIRGQVEAEEKFKLISRMKDKLSLTSYH